MSMFILYQNGKAGVYGNSDRVIGAFAATEASMSASPSHRDGGRGIIRALAKRRKQAYKKGERRIPLLHRFQRRHGTFAPPHMHDCQSRI